MLRACQACGLSVGVWSGGGAAYAERWVERLGLIVDWVGAKGDTVEAKVAVDDVRTADFRPNITVLHVGKFVENPY